MEIKFKRRDFLAATASALATSVIPRSAVAAASLAPDRQAWERMDAHIKSHWDKIIASADEKEVRADKTGDLLFLPFPYVMEFGDTPTEMPLMWAWDSDFLCRGLLAHGRMDLARNLILNHLFMLDRYGFMPNANVVSQLTRSQTPLIADTIWRFYGASSDRGLLYQAYPLLKRNYRFYWNAPHHQTPIGLATNRDLGDPSLPASLAAECETGLDWTPIYAGDVRRCVPLITNCALVRYAQGLARIAIELGRRDEAAQFNQDAVRRAALIRQFCWNEARGFFFEYDYVSGKQLPYISDCAYWTLWAGVATREQARRLTQNLNFVEQPFGLACTDRAYPLPLPASAYEWPGWVGPNGKPPVLRGVPSYAVGGQGQLQWMYPAGWAPMQLMAIEGLDAYGYAADAQRIASRFLALVLGVYRRTGQIWEKYNVVEGSVSLPNSRSGVAPGYGWSKAAAAILGRRIFRQQSLQPELG